MDTKKVTIIVVGSDDEEIRSIELSSALVKNYKKYLVYAGSAFTLAVILFFCVFAYSLKVSLDKHSLSSELLQANSRLQNYDSLQLHQKLNKIDNNLTMIDSYLQNRGIIETDHAGGEPSMKKDELISSSNTNIEKIDYFEKQSVVFYNTLRDIPIGFPSTGPRSSDYGYRRNPFGGLSGEFHPGVDFNSETGDPVYATGDGIINRCDVYNGYGNAIIIDHKSGYQTLFGHLSKVNVVQGQKVSAGDLIGYIGSTGRSTGSHLHYEIRQNGDDISPEPFLKVF
ncbi:MAG: M23 family metallopeptidase [Ignavibacteria bacterium]